MRFSHSKLTTFLKCPMTYHLIYDLGISPKVKPKALDFGSAVHWGLEHNTSNLDGFYKENQTIRELKNNDNQILAEVIVESFLKNKDKIFDKILRDETGKKIQLLTEEHELELFAKLPSKINEYNEFMGIIDLLLITEKGFIIVDYKTSSKKPDFTQYLSQLYKYIFLCSNEFPDFPVYKIAIINLQKSSTKRRNNQTDIQYRTILQNEYTLIDDEDDLIRVNIFDRDIISDESIESFKKEITTQCDYVAITSKECNKYNCFTTNWESAKEYGGSPYLDLLNNNYGAYTLYNVRDKYLLNNQIVNSRPMRQIDTDNIFNNIPLQFCRYKSFAEEYSKILQNDEFKNKPIKDILEYIYKTKITDEELINNYIKIYNLNK